MRSGTEEQVENSSINNTVVTGNSEETMAPGPPATEPLSS